VSQPVGWVFVPIGNLCLLNNGRAFKPKEWSNKGLPIVRIQNLNDPEASFNYYFGEIGDRYHLKGGELLFAWSGTPGTSFGAHVWRGREALLNQHIFRVDFDESVVEKRFFRHAINQKLDELIGKAHGGVGLRHVTKGKFEQTEITLPPRSEQTRIADKIESLLSKVSASRQRLERVPQILKKFRKAVLEAAVSGRLTEEWRARIGGEARGPWKAMKLAAVCRPDRVITYGVIKLGTDIPSGIPCLRTSNVRWLRIEEEGIKQTILRGDVVLVYVRGSLGGVAAVSPHMVGWNVSREVAVVPAAPELIQQRFLALWIATNSSQQWLTGVQKGVAYTGINIEDLRALPVRVPSLIEQSEIVRRVDQLFVLADRLQRRYDDTVTRVEQLTPSVLAKAFRGELVPQDPNDGPAGEMLERMLAIRNSPDSSNGHSKRKDGRMPRGSVNPRVRRSLLTDRP
jgi:type I restriction enzyme S subunit